MCPCAKSTAGGHSHWLSMPRQAKGDTETHFYICISSQLPNKSDSWCCAGLLWQRILKMISATDSPVAWRNRAGLHLTNPPVSGLSLHSHAACIPAPCHPRDSGEPFPGLVDENSAENLSLDLQSKNKTPHTCTRGPTLPLPKHICTYLFCVKEGYCSV